MTIKATNMMPRVPPSVQASKWSCDSVLSDRLGELTETGLIARKVAEGPPVSVRYTLTEAGRALLPALEQIRRWAERHLKEERFPITSA